VSMRISVTLGDRAAYSLHPRIARNLLRHFGNNTKEVYGSPLVAGLIVTSVTAMSNRPPPPTSCGAHKEGSLNRSKSLLTCLVRDESGQDLIEYALIAALIALVAIAGLNGLAGSINSEFSSVGNDI
jgi:pilus assembly protein Flp/PilA